MTLEELYAYVEKISSKGETLEKEDMQELITVLYSIIRQQNETILEFRNNYIRIENSMKLVEDRVQHYSVYKKLCETILDRINANPISALWFLYSVKRKIAEFHKGIE